ncbi:MAG: FtsQ-type POTRA domain-containing protein [Armatimonadetes bacterium]|nr:FtsQ-type POTRA domain-containing protein [Armatimonadota bacterium]MDE2205221.1 FtsQ-type POTRA domain-containing protein [Armatimonadota bacterium]
MHPKREPTKSLRRKPTLVRLLLALYLTLIVITVAALRTSHILDIRKVHVTGIGALAPWEKEQALAAARLPEDTNWVAGPPATLRSRLQSLPFVSRARVTRATPGVLSVQLMLRCPCARLATLAGSVEEDAFGHAIRYAGPTSQLPKIYDAAVSQLPEPGSLCDRPEVLTALSALAYTAARLPVTAASMTIDSTGYFWLNMRDGLAVKLGDATDLATKLDLLSEIYAREPGVAQRLAVINLECSTVPACIPRGEPQPAASVQPASINSTPHSGVQAPG